MYLEYKHQLSKEDARFKINDYAEKLDNMKFKGGFAIEDFKKSWTNNEMQFSFNLKKMVIDRRIKGNIKIKDNLIQLDVELPDVVKNFVTEKNLENTIRLNLDNMLKKE